MDAEVRRYIVKSSLEIRTWATEVIAPDAQITQASDLWAPPDIVEAYNRARASLTEAGCFAPSFDGPPVKILLPPNALEFVNDVDIVLQHVK